MEMSCETIEIAGKILSVDVDALEHKGAALRTVQCFGEYLEGHMPLEYISTLVEATASLMGSPLTKEVTPHPPFSLLTPSSPIHLTLRPSFAWEAQVV